MIRQDRILALVIVAVLVALFAFTCVRDASAAERHPLSRAQADALAWEGSSSVVFDGTLDSFENTDASVCCAYHLSPNRWRFPVHVHVTVPGDRHFLASVFVTWWPGERRPVVTWAWVHGHGPFSTHAAPLVVAPDPAAAS